MIYVYIIYVSFFLREVARCPSNWESENSSAMFDSLGWNIVSYVSYRHSRNITSPGKEIYHYHAGIYKIYSSGPTTHHGLSHPKNPDPSRSSRIDGRKIPSPDRLGLDWGNPSLSTLHTVSGRNIAPVKLIVHPITYRVSVSHPRLWSPDFWTIKSIIYYIYIHMEPKWPLFWLEKALFWGVDLQT